jgi:hypothetical protein
MRVIMRRNHGKPGLAQFVGDGIADFGRVLEATFSQDDAFNQQLLSVSQGVARMIAWLRILSLGWKGKAQATGHGGDYTEGEDKIGERSVHIA